LKRRRSCWTQQQLFAGANVLPLSFAGAKLFLFPLLRNGLRFLICLRRSQSCCATYQLLLQLESALSIAAAIVRASGIRQTKKESLSVWEFESFK